MAQILVPGYLRWDGFKYILAQTVNIVGPAGGDLTGSYPDPIAQQSSSTIFQFLGNEIKFTGGVDSQGRALPTTDSYRAGLQTTSNTSNQVLATITPNDGQIIRVIAEVMAVRTDVPGDAAWFLLNGVWLRSGSSLVAVKAPYIIDSGLTAGASAWTAQAAANGTAVEIQITGASAQTIHWSVVREWIEAS